MARRRLWLLFRVVLPATALFTPDFSFYPPQSINCLTEGAALAKCSGATVKIMNDCLCGNVQQWIGRAARCLGVEDPDDVPQVYSTMAFACSNTGTPLVVSEQAFQKIAKDAGDSASSSTTTTGAPTSTPTKMMSSMTTKTKSSTQTTEATGGSTSAAPTSGPSVTDDGGASSTETSAPSSPTSSPDDEASAKLSTGATVGIAVGASLAGVAVIAIAVVSLIRRKKRRNEEATPMIASPRDEPEAFSSSAVSPAPPASPPLPAELSSEVASPSTRHLSDQTLALASPNEGRQFSFWPAVPGQSTSPEEAAFSVVRPNPEIGERAPASEADQILEAPEIHELDGTSAVGVSSVQQPQQPEPWKSEHPQRWSNF